MNDYKELCKELINDHIKDVKNWDESKTRTEILTDLLDDTQNVFGNIDGSRTCNTWQAQEFINKSGAIFDDEILELFSDIDSDYFTETLDIGRVWFEAVPDTIDNFNIILREQE